MSRDVEERFITKLLECGTLEPARNGKITKAHFVDLEMREVYAVLEDQYARFNALPSVEVLQELIAFEPIDCDDVLDALMDIMREALMLNDMATLQMRLKLELGRNPDTRKILFKLKDEVTALVRKHADTSTDMDAVSTAFTIQERYERRKMAVAENNGITGHPWLWEYLNDTTGGINKEDDFVVVYGEAKSYKTWVTLAQLVHIHKTTGEVPLFVTQEMRQSEVQDRAFCLFSGLPWAGLNGGKLTAEEEQILKIKLEEFQDCPPFHIVEINSTGMDAVAEYQSKIEEHEAKIAAFDGVYFLSQTGSWQEIMMVTRAMRQLSLSLKVPMIAVTQGNSNGLAMYSKSFQQDATIMLCASCPPENRARREVLINVPFARNAMPDPFTINMRLGNDLSQKHVFLTDGAEPGSDGDDGGILDDGADGAITN